MTKLQIVIPTKNYYEGVVRILRWCNSIRDKYDIDVLLVEDGSDSLYSLLLSDLRKIPWLTIIQNGPLQHQDLRISYSRGLGAALANRSDYILTIETDGVPSTDVLDKYFKTLAWIEQNMPKKIGSVSTMYKWDGKYCWPTHEHWLTDKWDDGPQLHLDGVGI
jgi:hypothetical protein